MEYSDRYIMVSADQSLQDSKPCMKKMYLHIPQRPTLDTPFNHLNTMYIMRSLLKQNLDNIDQVDDTGLLESDPLTLDNILLGLPARYKHKSETLLKLIHGKVFWDSKGQLFDEKDRPIQHSHMTDLIRHLHLPASKHVIGLEQFSSMLHKIHVPNCLTGGLNTEHMLTPIKEYPPFTNKNKVGKKNEG